MSSHPIDDQREALARATRRGIGMPLAGAMYWAAAAATAQLAALPPRTMAVLLFAGTGLIFPLGWGLTRLLGGDLMAKRPPLTQLGVLLNCVQLLYWPVIVAVFALDALWVPFAMAALFGSHFLPYGWLYRSAGYAGLGIGSVVIASALQLAWPLLAFTAIPAAMALAYLAAAVRIGVENAQPLRLAAA